MLNVPYVYLKKGGEKMDIYAKKEYFVRTSLKELLLSIDSSILDVYYKYQDGEEIVTIIFATYLTYEVRVTGDSLLSIAKDVLKNI